MLYNNIIVTKLSKISYLYQLSELITSNLATILSKLFITLLYQKVKYEPYNTFSSVLIFQWY